MSLGFLYFSSRTQQTCRLNFIFRDFTYSTWVTLSKHHLLTVACKPHLRDSVRMEGFVRQLRISLFSVLKILRCDRPLRQFYVTFEETLNFKRKYELAFK